MAVKESSASKIKFKGVDALFGLSEEQECVREIPLDELDTFKNHPFKVFRDDKMEEWSSCARNCKTFKFRGKGL